MKKLITALILLIIIGTIYFFSDEIVDFVMYEYIYAEDFKYEEGNVYERNTDFLFVSRTDDYEPNNKQDILNIIYTALNKGWIDFTFFCPKDYLTCLEDVDDITNNTTLISNINNYVSTFNSYNKIIVNTNSFGRVNIMVDKLYNDEEINLINSKIDEIYNSIITNNMTLTEKIKVIHDYIINNTVYDEERSTQIKAGNITSLKHPSNTAYGPLFTGKAICGGYTDIMALFLDKLGVTNYKISSSKHIWNFLYIDNTWKHLDLTWDDPVVNTGENVLTDTFFLVSSNDLKTKETVQHDFDENIFIEAK